MKRKVVVIATIFAVALSSFLLFGLQFAHINLPHAVNKGTQYVANGDIMQDFTEDSIYAAYSDKMPDSSLPFMGDVFGVMPAAGFKDMSEAYQTIKKRPFDDETVLMFKMAALPSKDESTVLVYAPNEFFMPIVPENVSLSNVVWWSSDWYSYHEKDSSASISFTIAQWRRFNSELEKAYGAESAKIRLSDSYIYGALSQNFTSGNGRTQVITLEDNGRELCVFLERSLLGKCEWIHLYCVQEDVCYYVSVPWEGSEFVPPLEWLLSFNVTEYEE